MFVQDNDKITMLDLINLSVIDKIFKIEAEVKVGAMAQSLYINCLIHHFRGKEANFGEAASFEILDADLPYEKYKTPLTNLHKAGLVTMTGPAVRFNNVWTKHIDRTRLKKIDPMKMVGMFAEQTIDAFSDKLLSNERIIELMCMKYKTLRPNDVIRLIRLFITEQSTHEKKYRDVSDCITHCTHWIGKNHKQNQPNTNTVKSNAKILGQ